jgi:hypothetical protein
MGRTSRSFATAVARVASGSAVHRPDVMTAMCAIPSPAASVHLRTNSWLDSPDASRVLRVFSIASYGRPRSAVLGEHGELVPDRASTVRDVEQVARVGILCDQT